MHVHAGTSRGCDGREMTDTTAATVRIRHASRNGLHRETVYTAPEPEQASAADYSQQWSDLDDLRTFAACRFQSDTYDHNPYTVRLNRPFGVKSPIHAKIRADALCLLQERCTISPRVTEAISPLVA